MNTSRYLYDNGLGALPASEVLGKPTLRLTNPYMQGAHVRDAQMKLVSAGFPLKKYGVDAVFGPETQFAVKQFQSKNGINPTGIVNTETWMALYAVTPGYDSSEQQVISTGSRGSEYSLPSPWLFISVFAVGTAVIMGRSGSKSKKRRK